MEEPYSVQKLLVLRKLTRAVADLLRGQMKEYLSTLSPLLRPRSVLGDYVQGSSKEVVKGADKAFKELQALYESIAAAKPFNLPAELKGPVEVISTALEMTPMEYSYIAKTDRESKAVTITSPFKWVLTYSGFAPNRFRELLRDRNRPGDEMKEFLLHYLLVKVVFSNQTGVTRILEELHFPVSFDRLPDFGELPVVFMSSSISTVRPPDEVIIESTEISGMDAFEEVVNIDDIVRLRDPLKHRLVEIARGYGNDLLPADLEY